MSVSSAPGPGLGAVPFLRGMASMGMCSRTSSPMSRATCCTGRRAAAWGHRARATGNGRLASCSAGSSFWPMSSITSTRAGSGMGRESVASMVSQPGKCRTRQVRPSTSASSTPSSVQRSCGIGTSSASRRSPSGPVRRASWHRRSCRARARRRGAPSPSTR